MIQLLNFSEYTDHMKYESLVRIAKGKVANAKPAKKLPAWLRASLKDVEEGRVYGPFNTVKELRASLSISALRETRTYC